MNDARYVKWMGEKDWRRLTDDDDDLNGSGGHLIGSPDICLLWPIDEICICLCMACDCDL